MEQTSGEESRVIRCFGEFDAGSCGELAGALREAGACDAGEIVLDMTDTEFIDCHVCELLLDLARRLHQRNANLSLIGARIQPLRLLQLTGGFGARDQASWGAPFSGGAPAP